MQANQKNPYVGPRTFQKEEGHLFYGRDREARDLLSLVISDQLVLFYAQSGAGKSSLVNTRLIPSLESKKFHIPPVGRVSGDRPSGIEIQNIYAFNLMRSLIKREVNPEIFAQLTLQQFLARLKADETGYFYDDAPQEVGENGRRVLIIDQFEELFSTHPESWKQRESFFLQLAQTMESDPYLWVVLVMREDYIAALDPYAHLLPGGLRVRYYMQRLSRESALKAMKLPVETLRPYAEGVAERLMEDLSSIKVQRPNGTLDIQAGQYVEPVQLQVVCHTLWENLSPEGTHITEKDLLEVGDVDDALGKYYAARIATVSKDKNVKERLIREWIEKHLIAPSGIRNLVLEGGNSQHGELDTEILHALEGDLIRAEKRGGATFYELTHDRLVAPILENNQAWFGKNSSLLQQQAAIWDHENRAAGLLFTGSELTEAEKWAEQNPDEVGEVERDFLEACRNLRGKELLIRKRRQSRLFTIVVVMILMLFLTSYALTLRNQADFLAKLAQLNGQTISLRDRNFSVSLLLGVEAFKLIDNIQTRSDLLESAQANPRLLQYLARHNEDVYSIAFSPDGRTLASGSADSTIILWDVESRQPIGQPLIGHDSTVTSVAFSPDGRILASSSTDKTVRLWDVANHEPIGAPLTGHSKTVYRVAFSPDGKVLASSSADATIIFWDVGSRRPIGQPITGYQSVVLGIAFSPDGKFFASGDEDGTLLLLDRESRQPVWHYQAQDQAITSVAFSPDANLVASGSVNQTIFLWDVKEPTASGPPLTGHLGEITGISFSPDGKTLLSGSVDRTLILWNVESHLPIGEPFVGHSDWVRGVAFSPDGKTIASGGKDNMVILWDVNGRIPLGEILSGHEGAIYSVAFSPDGTILASSGADQTIRLWSVKSQQPLGEPLRGHSKTVNSLAFHPDGEILASGGLDGTIFLWDVESRQPLEPALKHGRAVYSVAFSPDGTLVASGGADNKIILWDVKSHQPIDPPLTGHSSAVNSLAFSPDGKILASGSADETVILWDVGNRKPIGGPLTGHEGTVYSVAFSPDGKTLASGSADYTIRLWDVETRELVRSLTDQSGFIYSVAFSPDGKTLASGGYKNSLLLWDLESHLPIGEAFVDNTLTISSLAFSPDGTFLASGSDNSNVILWHLDPQHWIEKICERVGRNFSRDEWAQYFPKENYRATCPQWPIPPEITSTPTP